MREGQGMYAPQPLDTALEARVKRLDNRQRGGHTHARSTSR